MGDFAKNIKPNMNMGNVLKSVNKGLSYRMSLKGARGVHPGWEQMGSGLRNIYRLATKCCVGKGLDVGGVGFFLDGGPKEPASLPGAIIVDPQIPGSGTATDLSKYADGSQDYILHSHCLEHVEDPEKAIAECHRVLKPGGTLFLYLPFPDHAAWDPDRCADATGQHLWQPTTATVCRLLLMGGFRVEYAEWEPDNMWSFVVIGAKL